MWLSASMYAYDVMDQVQIVLRVTRQADTPQAPIEEVLRLTTTVPGEGISDAGPWLRDALVAALEAL